MLAQGMSLSRDQLLEELEKAGMNPEVLEGMDDAMLADVHKLLDRIRREQLKQQAQQDSQAMSEVKRFAEVFEPELRRCGWASKEEFVNVYRKATAKDRKELAKLGRAMRG